MCDMAGGKWFNISWSSTTIIDEQPKASFLVLSLFWVKRKNWALVYDAATGAEHNSVWFSNKWDVDVLKERGLKYWGRWKPYFIVWGMGRQWTKWGEESR
jgi:hypothetical protein